MQRVYELCVRRKCEGVDQQTFELVLCVCCNDLSVLSRSTSPWSSLR